MFLEAALTKMLDTITPTLKLEDFGNQKNNFSTNFETYIQQIPCVHKHTSCEWVSILMLF